MQIYRSPMIAPDQDPERATAQHQIRILLERAIDDLPEAVRTVFVMRDVEEVTTEETATFLGIRQQTMKTRLHRARRMLRDALGDQIGIALKDAFPFDRPRCDRLVKKSAGPTWLPICEIGVAVSPLRSLPANWHPRPRNRSRIERRGVSPNWSVGFFSQ
jgi:predicted DNA-binding protein (UPF0251 family)